MDAIATGHYARLSLQHSMQQLLKAVDPTKDQTYFLSHVSQVIKCDWLS